MHPDMSTSESPDQAGEMRHPHGRGVFVEEQVPYQLIVDEKVTVVHVVWNGVSATGHAIRHRTDDHDPRIGEDLALGRALVILGRRMQKRANREIARRDVLRTRARKIAEDAVRQVKMRTGPGPSRVEIRWNGEGEHPSKIDLGGQHMVVPGEVHIHHHWHLPDDDPQHIGKIIEEMRQRGAFEGYRGPSPSTEPQEVH